MINRHPTSARAAHLGQHVAHLRYGGKRHWTAVLLPALPLLLPGCARTLTTENLSGFAKASTDIAQQADLAFEESNKLARNVSINRFIRSGSPGLSESQFQSAITPEAQEAWQQALSGLSDYATLLASLVDTKQGSQTSDAIVALGQKLQAAPIGAKIDPRVSTAFSALGGALINARAQKQARDIIRRTDPAVQDALSTMAASIGSNNGEGLRGTVYTNWNTSFDGVRRSYAAAATARQASVQRELIGEYLAGLDQRDAQLRSLANLRSSLVNLAAAHAAAAKDAPMTIGSLMAQIERQLEETKRIYNAATASTKEPSNAGQ